MRLSRDDWTAMALIVLAEGGLGAVAVEPIAAKLGATKGSGYWHFANRAALVEATLLRWEQLTEEIIERLEQVEDPLARLRKLLSSVTDPKGPQAVELSLLAGADDPAVAPVLQRVTERRIGYVRQLFLDLNFEPDEATRRSVLAYSTYVGHTQLARTAPKSIPTGEDRPTYLDSILEILTSRSST